MDRLNRVSVPYSNFIKFFTVGKLKNRSLKFIDYIFWTFCKILRETGLCEGASSWKKSNYFLP